MLCFCKLKEVWSINLLFSFFIWSNEHIYDGYGFMTCNPSICTTDEIIRRTVVLLLTSKTYWSNKYSQKGEKMNKETPILNVSTLLSMLSMFRLMFVLHLYLYVTSKNHISNTICAFAKILIRRIWIGSIRYDLDEWKSFYFVKQSFIW